MDLLLMKTTCIIFFTELILCKFDNLPGNKSKTPFYSDYINFNIELTYD